MMDLQTRKITFIQEFIRLQNEEIISGLESLLRKRKIELFEKSIQPLSIEQFNNEIDQALEDSEKGNLISATDLKDKIRKWVEFFLNSDKALWLKCLCFRWSLPVSWELI